MRRDTLRRAALAAMTLVTLAAASASADVAPSRPRALTLSFGGVESIDVEAPAADARAVTDAVRGQLARQQRRLSSCLANVDLREEPVLPRSRRLTGTMRFDRSGRPQVRITSARGIPSAARQCVMEVARAVSAPAPRGAVVLRFTYVVR